MKKLILVLLTLVLIGCTRQPTVDLAGNALEETKWQYELNRSKKIGFLIHREIIKNCLNKARLLYKQKSMLTYFDIKIRVDYIMFVFEEYLQK